MIVRFVRDSIRRSPKRKALIIAAIALGTSVATAMLGVMLSIGDKINVELRQAGANILVTPKTAALMGGTGSVTTNLAGDIQESDVPNIKKIFWALNITGISPSLQARDGDRTIQGVEFDNLRQLNPTWKLAGRAPMSGSECVAGEGITRKNNWTLGQTINVLGQPCSITGILSTGDQADDRILLPLATLQSLIHKPGIVDRIDVAALTKPEDDFARRNPKTMTSKELEKWNCTNYVTSIASQIQEAVPGSEARPVRRVADSEGKILDKIGGLMALITLAALLSAGLSVWSLTATTMMERRGEIAIMQAIGGARWLVAALLGSEIALIGLAGGIAGALTGVWLARVVGQSVFHDAIEISWILPFLIMLAAMLVALAGAAQPLRRALRLEPAIILREGI